VYAPKFVRKARRIVYRHTSFPVEDGCLVCWNVDAQFVALIWLIIAGIVTIVVGAPATNVVQGALRVRTITLCLVGRVMIFLSLTPLATALNKINMHRRSSESRKAWQA